MPQNPDGVTEYITHIPTLELEASEAKAKRESESRYRPAAYVDDPNGYIDGETLQEQRAQEAGYLDLSVGRRRQQQGQAALQQAWWD